MPDSPSRAHRAFTLIELLLVIGIIGVLAAIVVTAVNPQKALTSARDVSRRMHARAIEHAMDQYLVDNGRYPNEEYIPVAFASQSMLYVIWSTIPSLLASVSVDELTTQSLGFPICKQGYNTVVPPTDPSCVNLDALVPRYIAAIPHDPTEPNPNFSGYKVYITTKRRVSAVGSNQGKTTDQIRSDQPIDGVNHYAWADNVGWIDFAPTGGNVHVTDTGLTGYAWNEATGWISLSGANYGVTNDGHGTLSGYAWTDNVGWIDFDPPSGGVTIGSDGSFSGYAWGENIGWISFNCANAGSSCTPAAYKVQTTWRPAS